MSDYIEREAALKSVNRHYPDPNAMCAALVTIPAADVRPVVLCRDCNYADYSCMGNGTVWCMEMERAMREEDFCSRGADMRNLQSDSGNANKFEINANRG